jgi:bacterioferritin
VEVQVDKQTLIEALNGDLAREYQAIIQYIQYSALVRGFDRPQLAQFLRADIGEEQIHAQYLADKIVALGGVPTTTPAPVKACTDNMEILRAVLEAETTAVQQYKERIRMADEYGDIGLRVQLENFLSDETNHKEEVEKLIVERR